MGYTDKEKKIVDQIQNFCKNDCSVNETCAEDECILYRILKIIKEK